MTTRIIFSKHSRKGSIQKLLFALLILLTASPKAESIVPLMPGNFPHEAAIKKAEPVSKFLNRIDPSQSPIYVRQWIPVPNWLAGTWQSLEQTILASHNYKTQSDLSGLPQKIKINRISKIGDQRDRSGGIWHAGGPYKKVTDAGSYREVHEIKELSLVSSSPTMVEIKSKSHVCRYSKTDHKLIDEFKEETITEYTPLAPGKVLIDYHITDFSLDGKELFSTRSICTANLVEPFKSNTEDERGHLDLMFRRFLFESGLDKLIP